MDEPSMTVKIAILAIVLAVFAGLAIWFFGFGRRLLWPNGERLKRKTPGGVEVIVIIGPGMDQVLPANGVKSKLADACRNAIDSCFVVWNKYRPRDRAEESIDQFAVEFVTDEQMDARARGFWGSKPDGMPTKKINGYLWSVRRSIWGSGVPLAVIRGSLFQLAIDRGEPIIHEVVHALLGEFSKQGVDRSHSSEAWTVVWFPAQRVYVDRVSRSAST